MLHAVISGVALAAMGFRKSHRNFNTFLPTIRTA